MTNQVLIKGGAFLVEDITSDNIVTPEDFTEEHKMIAKTTSDFVKHEVIPLFDQLENQEFEHSVTLLDKAGALGLLSTDIPEKYGGLSLDQVSSSLIAENFNRAGGFAVTHAAHVGIGTLPIVFFGTHEQKQRYLPKLARGKWVAAYALTEQEAGSDALSIKTTAVLNEYGTHYVLNGEKQWITNSAFADVFIVYAKIDSEHFTAFIVERELNGISVGAEEKKMGIKSSSTRTLILDNVEVPTENILGEISHGHQIAFNILNIGRLKLAVGSIGGAKESIEIATKYVNTRKQFGQTISSFSLTKEKLGTMTSRTYANESAAYRTVGLFEERLSGLSKEALLDGNRVAKAISEYQVECSMNKFMCSELYSDLVDEAVQMHGGYGFMQEYDVERMYRDARINRIFEGTNEINRLLVPGTLMKKAMNGKLPLLQKTQEIQEELKQFISEEIGTEILAQENYLIKNAKKIFLFVAGISTQKHAEKLNEEQEILANLANIAAELYNMESALLRTEKAILKSGESENKQKVLYTEVYVQEAFNRIESDAIEILVATEEGEQLQMMLTPLRKLTRYHPKNLIAKKRDIATKIIETEKYVV